MRKKIYRNKVMTRSFSSLTLIRQATKANQARSLSLGGTISALKPRSVTSNSHISSMPLILNSLYWFYQFSKITDCFRQSFCFRCLRWRRNHFWCWGFIATGSWFSAKSVFPVWRIVLWTVGTRIVFSISCLIYFHSEFSGIAPGYDDLMDIANGSRLPVCQRRSKYGW